MELVVAAAPTVVAAESSQRAPRRSHGELEWHSPSAMRLHSFSALTGVWTASGVVEEADALKKGKVYWRLHAER